MPRITPDEDRAIARAIGRRMTEARIAKGLSQQALADQIGGDAKSIGRRERGERMITVAQLYRTAQALGVEPGAFFADTAPEPGHLQDARVMKLLPPDTRREMRRVVRFIAEGFRDAA